MSQISQIVSTATKRWQVEVSLQQSQQTMQKVLDNINANIFVSDYDTLKVLFANKPFREEAGQVPDKSECWKMLNAGWTACVNIVRSHGCLILTVGLRESIVTLSYFLEQDSQVRFCVADTGKGIPEEQ